MNTINIRDKADKLTLLIRDSKKYESAVNDVALICLSARVTLYLRNNDLHKLEMIEKEIDEALYNYGKYLIELKLPA